MKTMGRIACVLLFFALLAGHASAGGHDKEKPEKKALLLVAFGTSVPEALVAYRQVEKQAKNAFPDREIRWAYTSKKVRHKTAKAGTMTDSPEMAMARFMDEDFTDVAAMSLHAIPGIEFHDTVANLLAFRRMQGGIRQVAVSKPLLSSHEDCRRAAEALLKQIPPHRSPEDAVVLMGHGTEKHPSYASYYAFGAAVQELDPNVYIACVDGNPTLESVIPKLKEKKIERVFLMPFMAVAGNHARNDLAGEDKESWKSILTREGFACEVVLKGLAEYPEIVDIWLDHMRDAALSERSPR